MAGPQHRPLPPPQSEPVARCSVRCDATLFSPHLCSGCWSLRPAKPSLCPHCRRSSPSWAAPLTSRGRSPAICWGTVVVVVAGKLGDLLGRNRVLLGSVVVFVVGSVLCGLSQTMTMLAISRALQGVGAGAISVTAYALAAEVVPLRDRGRYQGVLGAVFGVNTVTGPLLGAGSPTI